MKIYIVTLLCLLKFIHAADDFDEGIDVAFHDGEVKWDKVKSAGIKFAIAQATTGNDFEDPTFLTNWKGMLQNGIAASAYHTMRGNHTGKSQADKIKSVLKKADFSEEKDIIAIAVEESGNQNITPKKMSDTLIEIIRELEKSSFKNIVICTGPYFWKHSVAFRNHDFGKYALWINHFSGERFLRIPETWSSKGYFWWRYSYSGKVEGVKGSVDKNRRNGTSRGEVLMTNIEQLEDLF